MARKLLLSNAPALNRGEQLHLIFSQNDISSYISSFRTYYSVEIDFPNYRINNGLLILALSSFENKANQNEYTYAIDYDLENNYFRCYFVLSSYDQSGNMFFNVELDNWGTYIPYLKRNNIHVTRCNRKLSEFGIYDEPKNLDNSLVTFKKPLVNSLSLDKVSIVILLQYNVSQSLFGNNEITKISLFAISFKDIYDFIHGYDNTKDNVEILFKVLDVVGGIMGVSGTGISPTLKAQVLKAWIVPNEAISKSSVGLYVHTKCLMTSGNEVTLTDIFLLEPARKEANKNILTDWGITNATWNNNYMPRHKVEVGAGYNFMPFTRLTGNTEVTYAFIAGNSTFSVFVEQGNGQEDITAAFEVELTTNNATETSLMRMVNLLSKTAKGVALTASGFAVGGASGAVGAAAMYGLSNVSNVKEAGLRPSIGSGDGYTTFFNNSPTSVKSPYTIKVTTAVSDEMGNAYYKGASFDKNYATLPNLAQLDVLGDKTGGDSLGVYIVADLIGYNGIPSEALEYIKAEFARGIYIEDLAWA